MLNIIIISGSVRTGRQSHYVALYLKNYIIENKLAQAEILDLKELHFPLLEERIFNLEKPSTEMKFFAEKILKSDAVIMVSPEYNSGVPASVKNAIDLIYQEWYRKPIGLVTVSSGQFGGIHALTQLQTIFSKVRAVLAPAYFPVPDVQDIFKENGIVINKPTVDKRAANFLNELLWLATTIRSTK